MDGVVPGRYYLGTNLSDTTLTATVPRAYYPGGRTREKAISLDVQLGMNIEGLILVMPDLGKKRKFRIRVVDEKGAPIPEAMITNEYSEEIEAAKMAALDRDLKTGPDGVATAEGFASAWYKIGAYKKDGVGTLTGVTIPPAEHEVTVLLVLKDLLSELGLH